MLNWFSLLTCGGETRGWILTSSLNAPITVSFSWSRQLFILSRRFLSMSGFLICEGKKIITMVMQRGGRWRAEAWSKRIGRSLCISKMNYLSLFFSTGVFARVVRHIWSSHVSNRSSVRFCVLFSESQRAFRALGAARPRYLSAAISMWIRQLFGCGIFPHTGSYQSRLTGHCLHSKTQRPSPEKKREKKTTQRQMSSLTPSCTLHPPPPRTQFPLLLGMRSTWFSYISQWP